MSLRLLLLLPCLFTAGCAADPEPLSGKMKRSACFDMEIPVETEASIAGVYEGRAPDDALRNARERQPQTVKLSGNGLTKPQILVLSAYEPVRWDVSNIDVRLIKGVVLYGYYGQRLIGLPREIPARFVHRYNDRFERSQNVSDKGCGGPHHVHEGGPELDALAKDIETKIGVIPVRFAGGYNPDSLDLEGGHDQDEENGDERFTQDSDRRPGIERLQPLIDTGKIRLATEDDIRAWDAAATARMKTGRLAPYHAEYLRTGSTYVVLKEFTIPSGMFGGYSRDFIVPNGRLMPNEFKSHNSYYLLDSGTCRGSAPDCDQRR